MSVKLRLQRRGRSKAPFYHIVVADSRAPRDGRFIEKIGTYNPLTVPATIELNRDKAYEWLTKGAQPTDTVNAILRFKGVLYMKHLMLGVKKGALTNEQAEAKLNKWIETKEGAIEARKAETNHKKAQMIIAVDGKPKPRKVVEAPAPVVEEVVEEAAPVEAVVEETVAAVEAPVEAVAEAVETVAAPAEEVVAAAETVAEAAAEATEPTAE